jgi:hypothetical protein
MAHIKQAIQFIDNVLWYRGERHTWRNSLRLARDTIN